MRLIILDAWGNWEGARGVCPWGWRGRGRTCRGVETLA